MIELDDKSYIVGMWFSSNKKTNDDWMSCIVRDPKDPTRFKGWSRFRTTKDAKIWDRRTKSVGLSLRVKKATPSNS